MLRKIGQFTATIKGKHLVATVLSVCQLNYLLCHLAHVVLTKYLFICLFVFERQSDRERQVQIAGSLPKCMEQPGAIWVNLPHG